MKTAIFSIKLEDNDFVFDSEQDTTETIERIYIKRLKDKYPNFNFEVCVQDDEKHNEETEEDEVELLEIRNGKVIHK